MAKNENIYLFGLTEEEMVEVYQALILRIELLERLGKEGKKERRLFKKLADQFTESTARNLRKSILDDFDQYIDDQVDDEVMWQQIEDELNRDMGE